MFRWVNAPAAGELKVECSRSSLLDWDSMLDGLKTAKVPSKHAGHDLP